MRGLEEDSAKRLTDAILSESGGEFQLRWNWLVGHLTPFIFGSDSMSGIPTIDVKVAQERNRKMKLLAIPGKVA
jgi:hypothetical protein